MSYRGPVWENTVPSFYDRKLAEKTAFYRPSIGDLTAYWTFPRQWRARQVEQRSVRTPRLEVFFGGSNAATSGVTVHDASAANIKMGFEVADVDRVLEFSTCQITVPMDSITRSPKVGETVSVRIGVDPANRVPVFLGTVENVTVSGEQKAYEVSCFDAVRRLMEFPFDDPSDSTDISAYLFDRTETTLYAATQVQIAELLSMADVLTHSLTGIEAYPIEQSNRNTLYEELSRLLRAAHCRAYLSPTGRMIVTYTDDAPLWAVALMHDLSNPWATNVDANAETFTLWHLPHLQMRAVYPNRVITHHTYSSYSTEKKYPNQQLTGGTPRLAELEPFEYDEDNVIEVTRLEDSEVINEVRSRTSPDEDTRDFIDMSGMTFEDLETLSFSQIGDASTSIATSRESIVEWGLRWRTYDMGGLSEVSRPTLQPTILGATNPPSVSYGRYAMFRGDFSEAQMSARRFPAERIRVTAVGVLSLLPFEVVAVNLPGAGFQGYYQVESRRLAIGDGGFRSADVLRKLDTPIFFIVPPDGLDVRE